jgi:hypothetical protein
MQSMDAIAGAAEVIADLRAAFERWVTDTKQGHNFRREGDGYVDRAVDLMWSAWSAGEAIRKSAAETDKPINHPVDIVMNYAATYGLDIKPGQEAAMRAICDAPTADDGQCARCGGTGEEPGSVRDPDYGVNACRWCAGTGEAGGFYTIDEAIELARLWHVGKCIGGDQEQVMFALLAEVDRLRKWQPIETAPKDGTWIVGWQPHIGDCDARMLRWHGGMWVDDSGTAQVSWRDPKFWSPLPAGRPK